MRLCVMRHGDAQDGPVDDLRPLSGTGVAEAEAAGRFLRRIACVPDEIWHSGLHRAAMTAEGVARQLGAPVPLRVCGGLRPGDDARSFADGLRADYTPQIASLLIVSHLPFVGELASLLLAGSADALSVRFTTGSVLCLERTGSGSLGAPWTLRFHASAKLIAKSTRH